MDRRRRQIRESEWPMTPVAEACEAVLVAAQGVLEAERSSRQQRVQIVSQAGKAAVTAASDSDVIEAHAALGLVLAEDVVAKEPLPPFPASIVDGYAVVSTDGPGQFPLAGSGLAGHKPSFSITAGQVAYITTGAPLPQGADAVVKVEDTESVVDASGVEVAVKIIDGVAPKSGEWVRKVGSDIAANERVLAAGEVLRAADIGLLAAVGATSVKVWRRPTIGVLSTGDELVEAGSGQALAPGQIRDSNRVMLAAAASELGATVVDFGIVKDEYKTIVTRVQQLLTQCDILVTSGGVSMGDHDFIKPLLEEIGDVKFGRVALKPGKPATFATVKVAQSGGGGGGGGAGAGAGAVASSSAGGEKVKLVFGLPGNPVSALVTFRLFVGLAVRKLSGLPEGKCGLPSVRVTLKQNVRLDPERPEYHRATVCQQGETLAAWSTGMQRSSRLLSMHGANALLCLPQRKGRLTAGSVVDALLVGPVAHEPSAAQLATTGQDAPQGHGHSHGHGHGHSHGGGGGGHGHSHGGGHGHSHGKGHHHDSKPHKHDKGHAHHHKSGAAASGAGVAITVGVLTVSDRASAGRMEDRGGPAVEAALKAIPGLNATVSKRKIVPDELDAVASTVQEWCDKDGLDFVITTGGTGFAKRDMTPDVVGGLLEKNAPGLVQAMLAAGMKVVPTAILSRPVAGIRGSTLVVTLPGSPKAVAEGLEAIAGALPHAFQLLQASDSTAGVSHPKH